MGVSVPEFWKLVIGSRLLSKQQCQLLGAEFGREKGADGQSDAKVLAKWLVSRNALTAFQAKIIQAGRSGPFHFGDYKLYDRVAHGPFTGSFRAIHEPTSHPVILKFVKKAASQDAANWSGIIERVQSAARDVHPHLNRVFEAVDLGKNKIVALEDVPGEPLGLRVESAGPLQWSDACRAARSVALAVAALHQVGKVHGDVRPQNIWLEPNVNFRLLVDPLYLPRPFHVEQADAPSQLLERSDYLAPELAQTGNAAGVLTDIYALGCTLYFLLSGRPPFTGGDIMQKMQRHSTEPIQPLEPFGVPPQVGQLVTYLMAKNPGIRYQQMSVVAEQILPYVDQSQLNIQPSAPPPTLSAYETAIQSKPSAPVATAVSPGTSFPALADRAGDPGIRVARSGSESKVGPATFDGTIVHTGERAASTSVLSSRARRSSRTNKVAMIAGLCAVAFVAIVMLVLIGFSGGDEETAEAEREDPAKVEKASQGVNGSRIVNTSTAGDPNAGENGVGESVETAAVTQQIVEDDKLPWASPTAGSPIRFDYVPQSTGVYFIVRPAEIAADAEGNKVLRGLGPDFAAARTEFENRIGFPLDQIEQLVVGVHESDGPLPRASFRVTLSEAVSESELLGRWGNPQAVPVPETNSRYYQAAGGIVFFLPPYDAATGVQQFLVGSETEVTRVAKGEVVPLLHRDIQHLLQEWSDAQRHFTLLFAPAALLDETGQKLFSGSRAKLKYTLDWFLPRDHIQAGLFSLHLGESFFLELRMKSNLNKDAYELAMDVQDRLAEVPDRVFNYVTTLGSHPYWERLRFKFPSMISELHRQTRIGTEKNPKGVATAVVNSYLPAPAASSLVVGAELAIASQPGVVLAAGPLGVQPPKDIDELMQKTLDVIDIPQNDLVLAIQDVKDAVLNEYGSLPFAFDIKLMGNHLMANGITKNQKVTNFNRMNATYADILTGICMTANPITTVTDPSETDQKLIWVIAPETPGGDRIVLITTRDAAAQNAYPLPKPFQPKAG